MDENQQRFQRLMKATVPSTEPRKFILDATCGGRTIWFNKKNPNAVYIDIRKEDKGLCPERPNFEVQPDYQMDFRKMDFDDKVFKLVVWDPPHSTTFSKDSIMGKKYGPLNPQTYPRDLKEGFDECWRVLEDYGILIFKWNKHEIPQKEVLSFFKEKPLFGHTTGSKSKTRWFCFMKIPIEASA